MLRTPFYQFHQDHGARFVDFAGWEMPITYGSILEEHRRVRDTGGLFDVSHMGRIKISRTDSTKLLEHVLTRRVRDMAVGACRYSLVCNEQGGTLDDVIVYRLEGYWMLVVNASNRLKIKKHLEANAGTWNVKIDDQTESTAMIALQGPTAMGLIGRFSTEVPTLKRYRFCVKNLMVMKLIISRTGYTGEDGVEVILPASTATMLVKMMLRELGDNDPAIHPAGLGARDTLRLEAGMPLYGHELDEATDPLSAGLGFAVSLDKGAGATPRDTQRFIGQDALEKIAAQGPNRRLVGLQLQGRRTPRQGMTVLHGDELIGHVTSGCLSPTLGHPIALAYVLTPHAQEGGCLSVQLGSTAVDARVVKLPFYKRP